MSREPDGVPPELLRLSPSHPTVPYDAWCFDRSTNPKRRLCTQAERDAYHRSQEKQEKEKGK